MPTYDYACPACQHRFEHFQSMSDARLTTCPACGREGLERLFGSGSGILFKGSGFYETDYKRPQKPGKPDSAGKDSAGTPAPDAAAPAASPGASDVKPAPAPPAAGGKS